MYNFGFQIDFDGHKTFFKCSCQIIKADYQGDLRQMRAF